VQRLPSAPVQVPVAARHRVDQRRELEVLLDIAGVRGQRLLELGVAADVE
jgi:hypothetical protein